MNPFSSAVNQKLFLARVLIKDCQPGSDRFGHAELALTQGALFELYCAFELYLNEIAANYKVGNEQLITDVEQLCQQLLQADKAPAEARELQNLLAEQGSWLNEMMTFYLDIRSPQPLLNPNNDSMINVTNLGREAKDSKLSYAHISHFQQAFSEIMERHRELMLEC